MKRLGHRSALEAGKRGSIPRLETKLNKAQLASAPSASPVGGEDTGPLMDTARGGFAALKDLQGRFRTQSLFWESRHPNYPPVFTLKKHEHENCISMYEKYMEIGDPTEYQVAIRLLGSWDHWCKLIERPWFMDHLSGWRDELMKRMESERIEELEETARNAKGTPPGLQATKILLERYAEKPKPKRGRPSKAEKKAALKQEIEDERDLNDDAKLIGLIK